MVEIRGLYPFLANKNHVEQHDLYTFYEEQYRLYRSI